MIYQITVRGSLDRSWSDWFSGLQVRVEPDGQGGCLTVFTGPVTDQAALRGIANRLWDLNLILVSIITLQAPEAHDRDGQKER